VFVSGRSPRFEDAQRIARRLGKRVGEVGLRPSLHHSEAIPGEGRTLLDPSLGLYQFDELVVLQSPMPSVLLEAGVIKNASDEALVDTDSYREAFARAVVLALGESCGRWGRRPDAR
jgi:N-acetylmuramoyl-L-alanine amidase